MSRAELQAIDRRIEALLKSQENTDFQIRESQEKTDMQLKELGKQIGGLGNKFGSFAEGLAYSSIERILVHDFKMNDFIAPSVRVKRGSLEDEYDVLAYSNGTIDKGMIVEIKSKLTQRDIDQMTRKMNDVFKVMPEHKDKTFYGMVAYVSGHSDLKRQILKNGWYLAHIGDEIFEMETPVGFQPHGYKAK
jgi:hypothetical protein